MALAINHRELFYLSQPILTSNAPANTRYILMYSLWNLPLNKNNKNNVYLQMKFRKQLAGHTAPVPITFTVGVSERGAQGLYDVITLVTPDSRANQIMNVPGITWRRAIHNDIIIHACSHYRATYIIDEMYT